MKILQIVTQMEAAGAQVAAVKLHEEWLKSQTDIKTAFLYNKTSSYVHIKNVDVISEKKPFNLFSFVLFIISLVRYIYKEQPTHVICHTTYSNLLGALLGKICGVKNIYAVHHGLKDPEKKFANWFDRILGICGFYQKIICVSKAVMADYTNYPKVYKDKLELIYNGLNTPVFTINTEFSDIKNENFCNLVNVGRLHPQKNQIFLLKLVKIFPNLRLFLVGEGELREDFEKFIIENHLQGRAVLLGELKSSDVFSVVTYADLFVFPSKSEAFGLSLLEAMLLGKPVLTSDLPCFKEILGPDMSYLSSNEFHDWLEFFSNEVNLKKLNEKRELFIKTAHLFSFDIMFSKYNSLLK